MSITSHRWTEDEVVDVDGPRFVARTYTEQAGVRRHLRRVARETKLRKICEVGAGYGRMCFVLREFCDEVVAFEHEQELLEIGSFLQPTLSYRQLNSIDKLPAQDHEFDFALTFTVIQHLTDEMAESALTELRRIVRPGGYVLLCEETDPDFTEGDPADPTSYFTFGRRIERYRDWMHPFVLVETSPRSIERGYPRTNVGDYLLFRAS